MTKLSTEKQSSFNTLQRGDPDLWRPTYGDYSLETQLARIEAIRALRSDLSGDPDFERACERTMAEVESYFNIYEGREDIDVPGSFAFIVPTRIERTKEGQDDDEYATEADSLFPALGYIDISSRQIFMAGMCPFIIDRYRTGADGRAGAEIYAPVLSDIKYDIQDPIAAFNMITKIMNDTTNFAKERLGVSIVSFAAMLPRLTNYGQTITTPDLITTTGHGATVGLVKLTAENLLNERRTRDGTLDKVGIVGTGAIGAAAAAILLETELTRDIVMSDINIDRGEEVVKKLKTQYPEANLRFTTDNVEAINGRSLTVSAVATRFDMNDPQWGNLDLEGAVIIDDSQPGAFALGQVEERGGNVLWPIGLDRTELGLGTLLNFDYGPEDQPKTGPANKNEMFGCEAEVVALYASGEFGHAIRNEVTPGEVLSILALMKQTGVSVAKFQCLGRYIEFA